MATVWQRVKNVSGSAVLPSLSSVTNLFTRNSYKDLDNDNDDSVCETPPPLDDVTPVEIEHQCGDEEQIDSGPAESDDQCDAGVARRRILLLLEKEEPNTTICNTLQSIQGSTELGKSTVDVSSENCQNELLESNQIPSPSQDLVVDSSSQTRSIDGCDLNSNSKTSDRCDPDESPGRRLRRRRDSYDRALADMRDSYDRVFTDIIDYSQDSPTVLPMDMSRRHIDAVVKYSSDENANSSAGFTPYNLDSVAQISPASVVNNSQDPSPKVPLRRQISDVIQKDLPAAIHVIRNRSYSKLGDDDEIHTAAPSSDSKSDEWHESFPVQQKKKSSSRKRPKKVWKKTKKAVRVTWKWLRRSFISYNSSFHYGIPITVAMYGGSRRSGRRAYYDYR